MRTVRGGLTALRGALPVMLTALRTSRKRRKLWIIAVPMVMVVAGVSTVVQLPITIVDTATAHLFDTNSHAPSICDTKVDAHETHDALTLSNQIPDKSSVYPAVGWILWRLAHTDNGDDYHTFSNKYKTTADALTAWAKPIDVVETIDPQANYAPHLLVALAAGYRLLRADKVTSTNEQSNTLIDDLTTTCKGKTE